MNTRDTVQEEALAKIAEHKKCGLAISMGVGKTRIAIKHLIANYDPLIKVLVVVPKNSVKHAWNDELEKMNVEHLKDHIKFTTYLSLNKRDPSKYDIVYLDECHSLLPDHSKFLDEYDGKILGLTGTPPVFKKDDKYIMVERHCPIVFRFSVDDATDNNILNDYRIIIHKMPLSKLKTLKKSKKNGGIWFTSEYKDYEYISGKIDGARIEQKQLFSILRMKALMSYTSKEDYALSLMKSIDKKCIIFANTKKQADKMCSHSYYSGNPKSEENLKLFKDGRVQTLSSVLQLSEGITIPNLEFGIIMHAYGNERKTAQRIGRLLRLNPDKVATCHILCYENTVDEKWVKNALRSFDQTKIKTIHINGKNQRSLFEDA